MNIESNIWKLRLFKIFYDFMIVVPILTIFWLDKGLTMKDVFILQSIFAIFILFLEVPSWYFADKFGRKSALVLGAFIYVFSFILYPFWETFLNFAIIEALLWIGCSFISWADSALLYDSLLTLKREKDYHKLESQFFSFSWYFHALWSILWWFLATFSILLPFYIQIPFIALIIPLSLLLKEPKLYKHIIDEGKKSMKWVITHSLSKHKEIKWLIIFSAFLTTSTLLSVWFAQPYWKSLKIPITFFGIIWAILIFLRWISSHLSPYIEKKLWKKYSLFFLLSLPFMWYIWLAIFDKYIGSIIFFLFFHITFWLSTPILKKYINMLVSSKIRATVLSIQSMLARAIFVIVWPIMWYLLDIFNYQIAFILSWFFFFLIGWISIFMLYKYKII